MTHDWFVWPLLVAGAISYFVVFALTGGDWAMSRRYTWDTAWRSGIASVSALVITGIVFILLQSIVP